MYGHVCDALAELNAVFSFPATAFLCLRLISSAFSLYVSIYGILNSNTFLKSVVPATITFGIIGFLSILIVFNAADMPIKQVV